MPVGTGDASGGLKLVQVRAPIVGLGPLPSSEAALDVRATNTTSSSTVVVSLVVGARVEEQRTLSTRSQMGATHATRWLLRVPGVETSGSSIPLPGRRGRVAVIVGFGADVASARRDAVARHGIPYRIDSGSAELLLPAELDREIWPTARLDWQSGLDVPELEVVAFRHRGDEQPQVPSFAHHTHL